MRRCCTRTRSTAARRGGRAIAAVVALLAVTACGSDDPQQTAGTADATRCFDDSWAAVDAGPFSFTLPAGVVDQEAQGIDSLVGRYLGEGVEVHYDYGWYSTDFGEFEDFGAVVVDTEVDGRAARRITVDLAEAPDEWWGFDHAVALWVQDDPGGDEPDEQPVTLAFWVGYDDPAQAQTAQCIVDTVRFA